MAKQKYKFERLTPIDNMDLDVYEEAIDYVFSNSDVKNVAISGAYSAGKSSVLASYKKKHDELRFLHISLAHFKSTDQESDAEVKESTLEGKILNQLIHQIPSEKIPQTNFRVKKTVSSKSIATSTIGAVLFLISILHLLFFSVWKNYIGVLPVSLIKSILMPSTHPYALIVDGIIILVLLSLSVYKLIRIQREKNIFRKLNIKGNEIEIFEKSDDSYFDKYLNEVLYLFENSDADVIVFEDMDRFNTNGIFERLREVNTLANIQLNKENEKVLRFFYLLRDDIFDSKDRTKFFDYIIPVVPVVDSSNSYDQFISQLKSAGTFEKFDKSFLQGLSLYIDDMRLLKNIYNEFIIYYNRLNITELDCNKMLAIIAYKNLFPRDFADLQLNQGFVCTLFSKKDKFVENEVSEIKREIEEIRSKISSYKAEHLISMRELNVVFADKYLSGYDLRRQNDNDLSEFITKHLSGSSKDVPYIPPEVVVRAREMDLLTYLRTYEPQELVHFGGNTYCTREHDSLKISNGKWCWFSRGIGGYSALDYLIKVKEMPFTQAVETIMGNLSAAPPAFVPAPKAPKEKVLLLPQVNRCATHAVEYLHRRGIDYELIDFCIKTGRLYESYPYHNVVFVGMDADGKPRYANQRGIGSDFIGDANGSDKHYSFGIPAAAASDTLHLFESAVDLLSYGTMQKLDDKDWRSENLLSLAGVYKPRAKIEESSLPAALVRYLAEHPHISRVVLQLDNDATGRVAAETIKTLLPGKYAVTVDIQPPPQGKDYNDCLCLRLGLPITKRGERSKER